MKFLKLIRVHQWTKNLFVFLPLFFAGDFFNLDKILQLTYAFVIFSLTASSIYIINDIIDVEKDRSHPEKKSRPIASKIISIRQAIGICILMLIAAGSISFYTNVEIIKPLGLYLFINLLYSVYLKNISIIDLLIVASGFVIRVYAGGIVASVPLSHWIIIMVYLLSLFLVLAKRRDDLVLQHKVGINTRKVTNEYNIPFVNGTLMMLGSIIIIAYIMYTVSLDVIDRLNAQNLYLTSIFVIAGILRYLQLTIVQETSGSPTKLLLKDRFIILTLGCWLISFFVIIYYL